MLPKGVIVVYFLFRPAVGSEEAENKKTALPENLELSKSPCFTPGAGQNTALHA